MTERQIIRRAVIDVFRDYGLKVAPEIVDDIAERVEHLRKRAVGETVTPPRLDKQER